MPSTALSILHNPYLRSLLLRCFVVAVPGLATILVVAHLVFGLGLDFGARRAGARGARSKALRFGLYSTGWDLVRSSPVGLLYLAVTEGLPAFFKLSSALFDVPTRGARAFLKGTYRLEGDLLQRVGNFGVVLALAASVACVIALFFVLALVVVLPL
jgi:hypothetical protein